MSQYSWRKDANHNAIVRAFRQAGASVLDLSGVGGGCPDLLVGVSGIDVLVEIKRPVGKRGGTAHSDLNHLQRAFHASWRGSHPLVVRTTDEVEAIVDDLASRSTTQHVVVSSASDDTMPHDPDA